MRPVSVGNGARILAAIRVKESNYSLPLVKAAKHVLYRGGTTHTSDGKSPILAALCLLSPILSLDRKRTRSASSSPSYHTDMQVIVMLKS